MILGHSWNEIYPVTPSEMSKIIIVYFYTEHCKKFNFGHIVV